MKIIEQFHEILSLPDNLLQWTEKDADYVKSDNTEMCPFCKSTAIYSGSWAPETCSNCGAQWMIGIWRRSKHENH